MSTAEYVRSVRALNDHFRKTLEGGTLVFTAGVMALGGEAHEQILRILAGYDSFNADNDPCTTLAAWKWKARGCSGRSTTTTWTWSGSQPIRLTRALPVAC
jgi:hypothetical protein